MWGLCTYIVCRVVMREVIRIEIHTLALPLGSANRLSPGHSDLFRDRTLFHFYTYISTYCNYLNRFQIPTTALLFLPI